MANSLYNTSSLLNASYLQKQKCAMLKPNCFLVGMYSILVKRLTDDRTLLPNTAVQCVSWYHDTKHMKEDIETFSNILPECPCDLTFMSFDPWWKWRAVEEEDRVCYYLWHELAFNTFGKASRFKLY